MNGSFDNQSDKPIMFTNNGLLIELTDTVCLSIEPFVLMVLLWYKIQVQNKSKHHI